MDFSKAQPFIIFGMPLEEFMAQQTPVEEVVEEPTDVVDEEETGIVEDAEEAVEYDNDDPAENITENELPSIRVTDIPRQPLSPVREISDYPRLWSYMSCSGNSNHPAGLTYRLSIDGDWRRELEEGGVVRKMLDNGWTNIVFHRPLGESAWSKGGGSMRIHSLLEHDADIRANLASTFGAVDKAVHDAGGRVMAYIGTWPRNMPDITQQEAEVLFLLSVAPLLHLRCDVCIDAAHATPEDSAFGSCMAWFRDYLRAQNRELFMEPPPAKSHPWLSDIPGFMTEQLYGSNTAAWMLPNPPKLMRWLRDPSLRRTGGTYPVTEQMTARDCWDRGHIFVAHRTPGTMIRDEFIASVPDKNETSPYWRQNPPVSN